VLCCEIQSCHACRDNDLGGHSRFSSTICSFSILCLEHHYCGDQQWRSVTEKLNPPGAFCLLPVVLVLFRSWSCKQRSWSWSCYFGLGLKNLVFFTSLPDPSWLGLLPPPQELHPALSLRPRFSALRASFGSFSQQSSFPPMQDNVLIKKTLVVPIFGAKECTIMQDFVLNVQKIPGVATPGLPQRKGIHLFAPTPCPPARCWCPSAYSRLATCCRRCRPSLTARLSRPLDRWMDINTRRCIRSSWIHKITAYLAAFFRPGCCSEMSEILKVVQKCPEIFSKS